MESGQNCQENGNQHLNLFLFFLNSVKKNEMKNLKKNNKKNCKN